MWYVAINDNTHPMLSHTQLVCAEYLFEVEVTILKFLRHYYNSRDIAIVYRADLLYDIVVDDIARGWMSIKQVGELCNV